MGEGGGREEGGDYRTAKFKRLLNGRIFGVVFLLVEKISTSGGLKEDGEEEGLYLEDGFLEESTEER